MVLSPAVSLGLVDTSTSPSYRRGTPCGCPGFCHSRGPFLSLPRSKKGVLRVNSQIKRLCLQRNFSERHPEPNCRPSGPVELCTASRNVNGAWHWDHPMLRRIFTGEMGQALLKSAPSLRMTCYSEYSTKSRKRFLAQPIDSDLSANASVAAPSIMYRSNAAGSYP